MYRTIFKRLIDIILVLIALPFFLLIYIIVAPIIYFSDKGPVFYNATRVGKDFNEFKMFKFRGMKVNAPDIRNPDGSTFNSENDPRVTKVGKFIRKTSIDELPQIINVLIGDMSFIGPRPILPGHDYSKFTDAMNRRMKVRPGITGYTQAYYRNSIPRLEKYVKDAYYVDNESFIFDVKIMLKTITTVVGRKNVNTNKQLKN